MTKMLLSSASSVALALSVATASSLQQDDPQPIEENPPASETIEEMSTPNTPEDLQEESLEAKTEVRTETNVETQAVAEVKEPDTNEPVADPTELAEAESETNEALSVLSNLTADYMSARDILGAPVFGVNGERIARVDDFVIGADDQVEEAILLSGGFFGLGGQKAAVDFDRLNLTYDFDRDPLVTVSMTEESIKGVAEYKQTEANDWSLASELIGASGNLAESDRDVTITDIILSMDGEAEYLIAADGLIASFGGDRRAIDYSRLTVAQGDGGVTIDLTPSTYDNMTLFTYRPDAKDDLAEADWSEDHDKKEKPRK